MKIIPVSTSGGAIAAYIDGTELPRYKELLQEAGDKQLLDSLLTFNISTYSKIKRPKSDGTEVRYTSKHHTWSFTFKYVNMFLATLNMDEQTKMFEYFIEAHGYTMKYRETLQNLSEDKRNIPTEITLAMDMISNIGEAFDRLDDRIDLIGKLRIFCADNVPNTLYVGAGDGPQHNPDTTFYPEEITELLIITLMCKLNTPVFGLVMHLIHDVTGKDNKVIHAAEIMDSILSKMRPIVTKLKKYIENGIKNAASSFKIGADGNKGISSAFLFKTVGSLPALQYAVLIARRFTNIDLDLDGGNIVTYIISTARDAVDTLNDSLNGSRVSLRFDPNDSEDGNDHIGQLETDSLLSMQSSDIPVIVTMMVKPIIERAMTQFDIEDDIFDTALDYYHKEQPISPSETNKFVNQMFYHKHFGGSKAIQMLFAPEYIDITALMQMILIQKGGIYTELAHVLTSRQSTEKKAVLTDHDIRIKTLATSNQSYVNCKRKLVEAPFSNGARYWDNNIETIANELMELPRVYNTAPVLWDFLGSENLNGKKLHVSDRTITGICELYLSQNPL